MASVVANGIMTCVGASIGEAMSRHVAILGHPILLAGRVGQMFCPRAIVLPA